MMGLFATGFLVFLLSDSPSPMPKAQTPEELSRTACYMAQEYVKGVLKAPKTAEFSDCIGDTSVSEEVGKPGRYRVIGLVDSQNSFSAMIRSRFVAVVEQVDPDKGTWRLVSIKM